MLSTNPFADLATVIPVFLMQYFVIAMVLLIIIGTGLDMLHKKNVVYFQELDSANLSNIEFGASIIIPV